MSIYGDAFTFTYTNLKDNICGFSSYPGELYELGDGVGELSVMVRHQERCGRANMFCFLAEKSRGHDCSFELAL